MEEKRPGCWKALRILSVVLLIFAVLAFLLVAFTFLVSFMIGGQIITDGSGLMRLFLNALDSGQRPIVADKFGLAGMPALGATVVFLVYCCVLVAYLRKRKTAGADVPGARGYRIAMCVLLVLSFVVPPVIWLCCKGAVAGSGFFTMPFPVWFLGWLILILDLVLMVGNRRGQETITK